MTLSIKFPLKFTQFFYSTFDLFLYNSIFLLYSKSSSICAYENPIQKQTKKFFLKSFSQFFHEKKVQAGTKPRLLTEYKTISLILNNFKNQLTFAK